MNDIELTSIFNSDDSNISDIKTQHYQIMATITYRILKLEPMTEKPTMANYTFFTVATFSNINSFTYIISTFIRPVIKN